MKEVIKQNRAELQEEFQSAKIIRDIKRELEKAGTNISLDTIKVIVGEYQRLTSSHGLVNDPREIVIDRSMIKPELPDDAA